MAISLVNDLCRIFRSSVSTVLPENLIRKCITYDSINQHLHVSKLNYNLKQKNVYVVGGGKAVQNMANELEHILSSKIKQGIISIPIGSYNYKNRNDKMLYCEGALNNLPDENALKTAQAIKDLVTNLTDNDFLIVLLSGGGSALLSLPKEPITLEEKTALIKKLANSGADIIELNTVRKRLSDLKGGKLALKAKPASVLTLILSDIVNDPIDLIASGPTCKDEEDPLAAMNIICKYKLQNELPSSIKTVLEDTRSIEIYPKNKVENIIIGSNKLSIEAAALEAKTIGFFPLALSYSVVGNVSEIAHKYVQLVKLFYDFKNNILHNDIKDRLYELNLPGLKFNINDEYLGSIKTKDLCLILGGEITVNVKGTGKGGRNQQLALEFSKYIDAIKNDLSGYNIFLLSAGTDGIDGPTDAAGAIGYINLISDCSNENIDVNKYINNNDSYNFFKIFKNGDLHVITGHTNTNVMDIHLIIIQKCT